MFRRKERRRCEMATKWRTGACCVQTAEEMAKICANHKNLRHLRAKKCVLKNAS
jgi:hypothetical protein